MRLRTAFGIAFAVILTFLVSGAWAADRKISLAPNTDLPGFDYAIIKGIKLDACQKACLDDNLCRAFTFSGKAGWCFLKGDVGTDTPFKGATSGKVAQTPSLEDIAKARQGEIPFPAQDLVNRARSFAAGLKDSNPPPKDAKYADLVAQADEDVQKSNPDAAIESYKQALAIVHNDPAVWLRLAQTALDRADQASSPDDDNSDLADLATSAATNALLLSEGTEDRAAALGALARALDLGQKYREAIATYRASIALVDDADLDKRLEKAVSQHGFRVVNNTVDSESPSPRICIEFATPLPDANTDLSSYVVVEGVPQAAVERGEQTQICITGVDHGKRYHIKLRAGLPSADGETLRSDVDLNLFVPDRKPLVAFANNAYVMPAGLGGGLPITSVNAQRADLQVYRIGDRSMAEAIRDNTFGSTLDGSSAENVADDYGEKIWNGTVDLAQGKANAETTTAIPLADIAPRMQPGAYVITAKVTGTDQDYWDSIATQWFIVTDLGLTTVSGDDGIHAFIRSLTSAKPVAGAKVRLVARNNEVLGETTSDADGKADFAPGLARGDGGRAPLLLVAETGDGDYSVLDLSRTAFDLTDRGVDGRAAPGPLDLFATTERGVYRPGETVFLTALLRDAHAKAVTAVPLTLEMIRPDGVVAKREVLRDKGAGGYFDALPLVREAMRGSWHIRLYTDPKASPLANVGFLVEDFEPDRLAFEATAPDSPLRIGEPAEIAIAARYLYGATAPNLDIEADAIIRAGRTIDAYPGYSFGRLDDTFQTDRQSLGSVGTTDAEGNATASITLPALETATTKPLQADLILSLVDTNGRTVQHTLSRPVEALTDEIGVKPRFDENAGLPENSEAGFDIIDVAPGGKLAANPGLTWTLSKITTNYQWYKDGGIWKWEAVTVTHRVADGTVDASASGPVSVSAHVDSGQYRFEIESQGDNPTSTTYEFYAGYYYPEAGSDTPDKLKVALDKQAYRAGDIAHLKLEPQFAGTALVMVVDDRIVSMQAVEVPAGGTTVDLPVTSDWSPGVYVTAMLYKPADAAQKRMPSRALGLAFADVDPGDLKLETAIEAPTEASPRAPLKARVKLGNVAAGEKAYVAVAAVDVGILNLTGFKVPDPEKWYFGQRQLGVEFRDLYGKLIDPTQGTLGAIRSGGDGGDEARLGTPPATTVLVALDSGVVTVGADGTAEVTFDMPDFNGSVRLMALAWTDRAVGHASADVTVHDPVVVNLSPPRFLRNGDKSRLLVEINNVSGPAGDYKVAIATGDGLSTDGAEQTVTLAAKGRTALTPSLVGTGIGDNQLTVSLDGPGGMSQTKQLTLGVRAASPPETRSELLTIEPGSSVTLDKSRFDGLVPHSASLTLAIGPIARLDVPELLMALDRYPYGCAEQLSSVAMPLLYLNDVARMLDMGTDDALKQRVKDTIANLLSKQTSSGSFGLWGPSDDDEDDLWLDSYVTEFLLRAKKEGYDVPEQALDRALDNLGNKVSAAADFDHGGEDIAYALYDLARAGRAAIGDLRYYFEARLGNFGSPLAQAQLGAALALYGDKARAATAFTTAVAGLSIKDNPRRYRSDYGSQLRDTAAVLALAGEFTPSGVDLPALADRLAGLRDVARYTSTQEDAWTLLAAAALAREATGGSVTLDGKALTGSVYRRYSQEHFDGASVTIANNGNTPLEAKLSTTGIPLTPPPARSQGFVITRGYFTPDGTKIDPTKDPVHQNDRFVVVVTVAPTTLGSGQYAVSDPLPAGFEIENPDLGSGGADTLPWVKLSSPTHTEARTDQYVAAFRYSSQAASFSTAYMVRATSPGTFVMPGATVEDMYRPDLRANTVAGTVEVLPPAP